MWDHDFPRVLITYLYLWVFSNWLLVLEYLTLLKGETWKRISLLRLSLDKMEFMMNSWIPMSDFGVCSVQEFLTAHISSLLLSMPALSSSIKQLWPVIWLRRIYTSFAFRCSPVVIKSALWSVEQILQRNLAAILIASVLLVACGVQKFFQWI